MVDLGSESGGVQDAPTKESHQSEAQSSVMEAPHWAYATESCTTGTPSKRLTIAKSGRDCLSMTYTSGEAGCVRGASPLVAGADAVAMLGNVVDSC